MKRAIDSVKIAALASVVFLCVCAGIWFIELKEATKETARVARETVTGLRTDVQALGGKLNAKSDQALAEVSAWRVTADRQLTAISIKADEQLTAIRTAADTRTGETLGKVDIALGEIHELRGSLAPILQHTASITAHADEASAILFARNALPAQLLGVTAAAKVTLGEAAQTMREFQRATPDILAEVKRGTAESVKASQSTALFMGNLARASRPLPLPLRLGLQIAPPLARIGADIVTTMAIKGRLQ